MLRIALYIICSCEVLFSLVMIILGSDNNSKISVPFLFSVWLSFSIFIALVAFMMFIRSTRHTKAQNSVLNQERDLL